MHTRHELSAAALALFAEFGHESTTVDQIAARAGVARRTFFRYFASKDDAVLPDHDTTVGTVQAVLEGAAPTEEPLAVVCRAIREVLRMYTADPSMSLARYRLLRQVPALREREIAVVSRYERLFTKYLLSHPSVSGVDPDSTTAMLAEVSASAVVASHNHVLRRWLRTGATGDAMSRLDEALAVIRRRFSPSADDEAPGDIVVTVVPGGTHTSDVLDAVRRALD
ncbi:HTH tetR-type domain-containing protein [Stackebrandtia soli]